MLGLLYSLTNHARFNELTAIRAAGISLWRISLPYLALGFLFSLGLFASNEFWVPSSHERAEELLASREAGSATREEKLWTRNLFFRNDREARSWNIQYLHRTIPEMRGVQIIMGPLADGTRREIYAERALFEGGRWRFLNVQDDQYSSMQDVTPTRTPAAELELPELTETPRLIRSEIRIASLSGPQAAKRPQLSIAESLNYLHLHPNLATVPRAKVLTQLHGRIAAPWTCLVVVLIAIPFGAPSGRRNVFVGVASSIVICFVYFILMRIGLSLGTGGYLPPWLSAWLPNLFFGTAAIVMISRVR